MNTDWAGIALVVTSFGTLIASIGSVYLSVKNGTGIHEIKVATDGMKDQLVAETGRRGVAEGIVEGRAAAHSEHAEQRSNVAEGLKTEAKAVAHELKTEAGTVASQLKDEAARQRVKSQPTGE